VTRSPKSMPQPYYGSGADSELSVMYYNVIIQHYLWLGACPIAKKPKMVSQRRDYITERLPSTFCRRCPYVQAPLCRTCYERVYSRCLVVFAARPHYHICRRRLRRQRPVIGVISSGCFFEETHKVASNTAEITVAV
jgi:hypothetical protein